MGFWGLGPLRVSGFRGFRGVGVYGVESVRQGFMRDRTAVDGPFMGLPYEVKASLLSYCFGDVHPAHSQVTSKTLTNALPRIPT